ncbi:hypothetical protein U0L90_09475 [Flavobacteriaceae sp. LMIT009]
MVNNDLVSIDEIKDRVKLFVDNNGDNSCDYCNGLRIENSSDNPTKAVVSLKSGPQSTYNLFIKVQDELKKEYFDLRVDYARKVLNKNIEELTQEELKQVKEVYPFIVSEAETN